jgi:cholesterol transport system auxiliary component
MKRFAALLTTWALAWLLAGCAAVVRPESPSRFDLGPLPATPAASAALPALPPLAIAEINAPAWLDRPLMFYRLAYTDTLQPRSYAQSRWAMPPAQLLEQRLKARIAATGGVVLSAADSAVGVPTLHIEADDFIQAFDAPGHSIGRVALRVSAFQGRRLIAQRSFIREAPAPSADAEGGAHALAQASDAAIDDIIRWLATLPLKPAGQR